MNLVKAVAHLRTALQLAGIMAVTGRLSLKASKDRDRVSRVKDH